jgi:hypothetical protein
LSAPDPASATSAFARESVGFRISGENVVLHDCRTRGMDLGFDIEARNLDARRNLAE